MTERKEERKSGQWNKELREEGKQGAKKEKRKPNEKR